MGGRSGFFALLLFIVNLHLLVATSCGPLPSKSVCQGILPLDQQVNVGTTSEENLFILSALWSELSAACRNTVAVVACQKEYPPCPGSTPLSCQASCDLITNTCTADERSWVDAVQSLPCAAPPCQLAPSNLASASPAYPKCETYTGTLCKDTLAAASRTTVYVKAGYTQADIEAEYVQLKKLLPLAPRDTSCVYRALDFYCGLMFPACDTGALATAASGVALVPAVPFPKMPCRSACDNVTSYCGGSLTVNFPWAAVSDYTTYGSSVAMASYATPACGSVGTYTPDSSADFPSSGTNTWNTLASGTSVRTTCQAGPTSKFSTAATSYFGFSVNAFKLTPSSFFCPSPLLLPKNQDNASTLRHGMCGAPCPVLRVDESTSNLGSMVFAICSIVGFLGSTFTVISYFAFPEMRKNLLLLQFIFGNWLWAFTNIIAVGITENFDTRTLHCRDDITFDRPALNFSCRAWAYMVFFSANSMLVAFFGMSTDLFLKIGWKLRMSDSSSRRMKLVFIAAAWIVPLIQSSVTMAVEGIGGSEFAGGPCAACTEAGELIAVDVLMLCLGSVGFVMLTIVIYNIWMIEKKDMKVGANEANLKSARTRIITNAALCAVYFLFLSVRNLSTLGDYSSSSSRGAAHIDCLINNGVNAVLACGTFPGMVSPMSHMIYNVLMGGIGLLSFFVFGCDGRIMTMWCNYQFGQCCNEADDDVNDTEGVGLSEVSEGGPTTFKGKADKKSIFKSPGSKFGTSSRPSTSASLKSPSSPPFSSGLELFSRENELEWVGNSRTAGEGVDAATINVVVREFGDSPVLPIVE